jgi:hypothetical protein
MTRRLAARVLAAILTLVTIGAMVGLVFGFDGLPFAVAEIAAIAGLFALDRCRSSIDGIAALTAKSMLGRFSTTCVPRAGWRSMMPTSAAATSTTSDRPRRDPTVETKSHPGRISVARIDQRWLRQAYAEALGRRRPALRRSYPCRVCTRANHPC